MNKTLQNIFILIPLVFNVILKNNSKLVRFLTFSATIILQFILFFSFKEPNCYDRKCEEIELSNERKLYYEKYNTLDDDLNTIRSEHYQQSFIIGAFNYQLAMFLICFSLFHEEKYEKTVSKVLYVILSVFSIETTYLLQTEYIKLPISNLTYFELFSLLRILETSLILIVRDFSSLFSNSPIDALEKSIQEEKSINHKQSQYQSWLEQLKEKPQNGIFSTNNMRSFISIFGIAQLFLV